VTILTNYDFFYIYNLLIPACYSVLKVPIVFFLYQVLRLIMKLQTLIKRWIFFLNIRFFWMRLIMKLH